MYRQGDVIVIPCNLADDGLEETRDPRGLVLAEGETSMHYHALFGNKAKLFRFRDTSGRLLAVVPCGGTMRVVGGGGGGVDRHEPIVLPAGRYEIRTQRSWTSANRSRRVED